MFFRDGIISILHIRWSIFHGTQISGIWHPLSSNPPEHGIASTPQSTGPISGQAREKANEVQRTKVTFIAPMFKGECT